jgi:predicted permease
MGGGYLVALLFVWVTGVDGVTRSVLMLVSVMPSAVINFVFAQKYGDGASEVAATVFVSTLVSLVAIPLVLAFGL